MIESYKDIGITKEQKIIRELATKYNLPKEIIHKIVYTQFKYLNLIIKKDDLNGLRLPLFGSFVVKHGTLQNAKRSRKGFKGILYRKLVEENRIIKLPKSKLR